MHPFLLGNEGTDVHNKIRSPNVHAIHLRNSIISHLLSLVVNKAITLALSLLVNSDLARKNVSKVREGVVQGLVINSLVQVLDEHVSNTGLPHGGVTKVGGKEKIRKREGRKGKGERGKGKGERGKGKGERGKGKGERGKGKGERGKGKGERGKGKGERGGKISRKKGGEGKREAKKKKKKKKGGRRREERKKENRKRKGERGKTNR